ncbi:Uncharacterised protein [Vibrio cholerae]|nr:Uncharacterised protein [Vibrio cholerae]
MFDQFPFLVPCKTMCRGGNTTKPWPANRNTTA